MQWQFEQLSDLRHPTGVMSWPDQLMVEGDHEAHVWRVHVLEDAHPVDMTGYQVMAYFDRIDGMTVPVPGTADGNLVSVTLPQSVYAAPGGLLGVMRASRDGQTVTLAAGRWTVRRGPGDVYVDPGHVIPSLDELLAKIGEMEAATASAQAAASAAYTAAETVVSEVNAIGDALGQIKDDIACINDDLYDTYTVGEPQWTDGKYLKNGVELENESYYVFAVSVIGGSPVILDKVAYSEKNRQICMYDAAGQYIGNAEIEILSTIESTNIKLKASTSTSAATLKGSVYKTKDGFSAVYENAEKTKKFAEAADMAGVVKYADYTDERLIATWIDDDTGDGIVAVKALCDALGIKCTFAGITVKMTPTRLELLQAYQREGYHVANHSYSHSYWYKTRDDGTMFSQNECYGELIDSMNYLRGNGFFDYDLFIYPGNSDTRTDIDVKRMVKQWCRYGVRAGGGMANYCTDRFGITRRFISTDSTVAGYQAEIDAAKANGCRWLVFGTHSSDAAAFDSDLTTSVLQYAIDAGYEFMPLNEAVKYKEREFARNELQA